MLHVLHYSLQRNSNLSTVTLYIVAPYTQHWSRPTSEPPGQLSSTLHHSQTNSKHLGQNTWTCQKSPSLVPPHSSPPPLQVLIPSVKLDYSHVQSRCGSLDRRGYSAGGGNVSLCAASPLSQCSCHCCFSVVLCQCFFFHLALASQSTVIESHSLKHWFVSCEAFGYERLNVSSSSAL